jgi:Flp pilus assembly protein TadD
VAAFERAVAIVPEDAEAHLHLSESYREVGFSEAAEQRARFAREIDPAITLDGG